MPQFLSLEWVEKHVLPKLSTEGRVAFEKEIEERL